MPSGNASIAVGAAAALATVAIAVGWQLATRSGVTTALAPIDLAVIRYGVPALLLSPIWLRHGVFPRHVPGWVIAAMILGGGWPFGLIAMSGAQFAPVAHMGAMLPGTMPLMVALLSALILKERFTLRRMLGFVPIVAGVLAISAPVFAQPMPGAWIGDLLFLAASALWAFYTIAFRKSGLSAWHAAALIAFWSAVLALPAWALSGTGRLLAAPAADLAFQDFWQGFLAGVVAIVAFGVAVRRLGPSKAALSGALVPACAAIAGYLALGERIDDQAIVGVVLVTVGVALASR
jgi:drug/metabolite transporter (DMT)-like permease